MDGYLGTILAWAPNFAPLYWEFCRGQLLNVSMYQALFSLLGNTYGGDGRTTFALPNLCGRVIVGTGQGTGTSVYSMGMTGGAETVTLSAAQIPIHSHAIPASGNPGSTGIPSSGVCLARAEDADENPIPIYSAQAANTTLAPTGMVGGGNAHTNLQPFMALNYIICVQGMYPERP